MWKFSVLTSFFREIPKTSWFNQNIFLQIAPLTTGHFFVVQKWPTPGVGQMVVHSSGLALCEWGTIENEA
jgi:hypothetical protein